MLTENGKFSFMDVQLVSKHPEGKFFGIDINKIQYEIEHDVFKSLLILIANRHKFENVKDGEKSTLDFMLDQLETTDEIFIALLHDYTLWTH